MQPLKKTFGERVADFEMLFSDQEAAAAAIGKSARTLRRWKNREAPPVGKWSSEARQVMDYAERHGMTFGQRIQRVSNFHGRAEVAERFGASESTVEDWERRSLPPVGHGTKFATNTLRELEDEMRPKGPKEPKDVARFEDFRARSQPAFEVIEEFKNQFETPLLLAIQATGAFVARVLLVEAGEAVGASGIGVQWEGSWMQFAEACESQVWAIRRMYDGPSPGILFVGGDSPEKELWSKAPKL